MKFLPESRFEKKKYFPVCVKKNIVLFVFKKIIALFVISYCPVCVLLNLNLAPTCKNRLSGFLLLLSWTNSE